MTDLVTVVIPTFNRKHMLQKAVASVVEQNVPGVIVHIYDNCSTDDTEDFVKSLMVSHPQICYTRRSENIGSLRNYADALSKVETPYYIPLADDDWLLPDGIAKNLAAIQEDDSLGAVISQANEVTIDGKIVGLSPSDDWDFRRYEPDEFFPLFIDKGHFQWSSILFRTSAMKAIGGYNIDVVHAWDVEFQVRLFKDFPVKMIKNISAVFLFHEGQSHTTYDENVVNGMAQFINQLRDMAATDKPEYRDHLLRYSDYWEMELTQKVARSGSFQDIFALCEKVSQGHDSMMRTIKMFTRCCVGFAKRKTRELI